MLKSEGSVGGLDSAEGRGSYCYVLLKSDFGSKVPVEASFSYAAGRAGFELENSLFFKKFLH